MSLMQDLFADAQPAQGFDVSVTIMGPNGPELVGEYQEVSVEVKDDSEEYMTCGDRIAMILDGEIKISGKLKRGMMNTDLISRLYGQTSLRRGETIVESPRFNIIFSVQNPAKGISGRLRVERVKLEGFSLSAKAGKGVVDKDISFKAEGIAEL